MNNKSLGQCSYYIKCRKCTLSKGIKIKLSKKYIWTREQYMNTLTHEMIHGLNAQKSLFTYRGSSKEHHGYYFLREMNRINRDFEDIKISVRCQKTPKLSKVDKKSLIFVKFDGYCGKLFGYQCFRSTVLKDEKKLDKLLNKHIKFNNMRNVELYVIPIEKYCEIYTNPRYTNLMSGRYKMFRFLEDQNKFYENIQEFRVDNKMQKMERILVS